MISLKSEKLIIRDHIETDLESFHQWISDTEVMAYLSWKTNSIEESKQKLDESIAENNNPDRKKYFFAIIQKEDNSIIGETGFTIISKNQHGGVAECGYFFTKKQWGRGFATEAVNRIIEFAFYELGLHKIIASCDCENKISERIMVKCGMIKEAEFRQHSYHRSKWCDRLQYAILKNERE